MGIKQVSVFVENKKGSLHEITDLLAKANVDLRSMCIADTSDYGIVRMIADDAERAQKVLCDAGHTANIRTVTAFAVPDEPGGLLKVLSLLAAEGVNIEYSYAYLTASENKACAVLRVDDNAHAEEVLNAHGIVTRMTKGGIEPAV